MMNRLRSILLTAVAVATLGLLDGCFSLGAVPPPDGLSPAADPTGHDSASYDPSIASIVESDWGPDAKFVLLHPLVNGQDVGWFIFDTGASGCTITAAAAENLPAIATTFLQNQTLTTVFRCDTLRLGPLTLTGLRMTGINMPNSTLAFGRRVVGILGRDVCSRAVIELDGPSRAVRIHAPGAARPSAPDSLPIEFRRGLPHLRCHYAGASTGLFILDSGADAGVHFFAHAVEREALTSRPDTSITRSRTQMTLGSVARIREGSIADFRIGTLQCAPVLATFAQPGDAPSKLYPDVDGLIGMRLLNRFGVFIDEAAGRVDLVNPPQPAR